LVARGIESLLLKGYVYIETDNSDRRIQHLFLTEAAQEVIQVLLKKRSEVEAHILKGIPQEHINIVLQTFDRINANIENIIETNEHTLEE
ncbi:MarR family transcriptional regulator, partial [[Clostridium] innocuum]|nr:MarR family transcriptional regulator [[Clostridium] innocuum]